jgi:2'-5' RNA ligase
VGGDLGGATPTAGVGPAVSRLGRNGSVLCVPVAGLDELAAAVLARTAHLGRPPEHRRFAGHLTVGRLRQGRSCGLAGHRIDTSFTVSELVVVTSTPAAGAGPAEWHTEGVVPLARGGPQVSPSSTSDAEFMQ